MDRKKWSLMILFVNYNVCFIDPSSSSILEPNLKGKMVSDDFYKKDEWGFSSYQKGRSVLGLGIRIRWKINFQSIQMKSIPDSNRQCLSVSIACISIGSTRIEYKLTNVRHISLKDRVHYQIFIASSSKKHTIPPSFLCRVQATHILKTKKRREIPQNVALIIRDNIQ